jgi:hypothetical protein
MQSNTAMIRHIFQNHISVHPKWDAEKRKALQELLGMEDEEMDELYLFSQDVANHCLDDVLKQEI